MIVTLVIFLLFIFVVFIVFFQRIVNRNMTSAVSHLDEISQEYRAKEEAANKKLEEAEKFYKETMTKAKEDALLETTTGFVSLTDIVSGD